MVVERKGGAPPYNYPGNRFSINVANWDVPATFGNQLVESIHRGAGEGNGGRIFDVTGDGREEVVMLTHDKKIAVYFNDEPANVPRRGNQWGYRSCAQVGSTIYNYPLPCR